MMSPEERGRLERVEELLSLALGAMAAPVTLGGDSTGPSNNNTLVRIASLIGLGPTIVVAVDINGNIISGGAPATADPFALLSTITDNLVPSSAIRNYDFDISTATYTNSVIRLRALGYATTKDVGGVPTANLTGVAYAVTDAVFENTNGSVSLASPSAGGAANPMPSINNEMTLEPQSCDAALRSGGGSPPNLAWTLSVPFARLQLTATNAVNRGSWKIDVYQRLVSAP